MAANLTRALALLGPPILQGAVKLAVQTFQLPSGSSGEKAVNAFKITCYVFSWLAGTMARALLFLYSNQFGLIVPLVLRGFSNRPVIN